LSLNKDYFRFEPENPVDFFWLAGASGEIFLFTGGFALVCGPGTAKNQVGGWTGAGKSANGPLSFW